MQNQLESTRILGWMTINGHGYCIHSTFATLLSNGLLSCGKSSPLTHISLYFVSGTSRSLLVPRIIGKAFSNHCGLSSWGAAAMCSGAVTNFAELLVCRGLLGVFESVFGCGAPYFLSLFYQRKELGFRLSMLLGMSPVANCFASALAYGITQIKGSLEPWRYLFIIGMSTILASRCKTD
jgi:MFS family permease